MKKKLVLAALMSCMLLEGCVSNNEKKWGGVFLESTGLNYDAFEGRSELESGEIVSYRYTYYDYDEKTKKYITNPRYTYDIQDLPCEKTAIIVMDPWKDNPDEKINRLVEEHVRDYLLPAIAHAIDKNISVYVFTNNPDHIAYDTKIDDSLQEMVDNGEILLFYHDDYTTTEKFIEELRERGIENLIYTGYSTHLCVLYRNIGIMSVFYSDQEHQLNMYIIPEATQASCVAEAEDITIQMRNDICTMISQQGIANIITLDDFMKY